MNLTQILRNQESVLTLTVYADGDPSDEGTATFTLTHHNGTQETLPVTDNGDGTYNVTVPAKPDLALYTATLHFGPDLSFDQGRIEIVGGMIYTEPQARAVSDAVLSDPTKYDDDDLAAARIEITDWLENETGRSWIPRYRRLTLRGNNRDHLPLRYPATTEGPSSGTGATRDITKILTAEIDGTWIDVANIDIEGHHLWLDSGIWLWARRPNIIIEIEYGIPHIQSGVTRIALLELEDRLPASRLGRNIVSSSDELGSYSWDPQNNGRPSRVPDVNAWLRNEDRRIAIA